LKNEKNITHFKKYLPICSYPSHYDCQLSTIQELIRHKKKVFSKSFLPALFLSAVPSYRIFDSNLRSNIELVGSTFLKKKLS